MINVIVSEIIAEGLVTNYKDTVDKYTDYYKMLDCNMFDIVSVTFKGEYLTLFVDDEGLFKPDSYGRNIEGIETPLFGNIVIAGGVDDEGNTLSVPDSISIIDIIDLISDVKYATKGE